MQQFRVQHFIFLISIIFLHFVILRPGNFPLTLAPFAAVYFYFNLFNINVGLRSRYALIMLLLIAGLPVVNALQLGLDGADSLQFLRTYGLWVTSASLIALSVFAPIRRQFDMTAAAVISLLVILLLICLQALLGIQGDTSYFNLFGSHQYFGEIELETLAIDDRIRPPGFYLEPSFCAYVVTNLCSICLLQGRNKGVSLLLASASLLLIQSFTGFLAFGIIGLAYVASMDGKSKSALIFGIVSILAFSTLVWYYYGDYIGDRTNQVGTTGSSTYYRIVGLLPVLSDVLVHHPMGLALGRVREIVPKYQIPHGVGYGESIDNGLYLLIFYFGWLGLLLAVGVAVLLLVAIARRLSVLSLCVAVLLLGCFFNGGIFLPEFALMAMYLIYAAKSGADAKGGW